MKRVGLIALVLLLAAALPIAAQDVTLAAGPKAGLNFGWASGDDRSDSLDSVDGSNRVGVGLAIGGFLEVGILDQFAVQPELLFFQEKSKASYEAGPDDVTTTDTANTLQLPILAKGLFPVGDGTLYGVLGPTLSFVLGDVTSKVEVDGDEDEVDTEPDNSALFGFALGLGYEQMVGPGMLSGELRYSREFTAYFDDNDSFSNTISILVGYGFAF
jgi:hypothetical protein